MPGAIILSNWQGSRWRKATWLEAEKAVSETWMDETASPTYIE